MKLEPTKNALLLIGFIQNLDIEQEHKDELLTMIARLVKGSEEALRWKIEDAVRSA